MKKEILIIIESLAGGGAEKVLVDLLRKFDYSKYDLTLLVRDVFEGEDKYIDQIPQEVTTLILNKKRHNRIRGLLNKFPLFHARIMRYALRKKLGNKRFDAIISWCEGPAAKLHSQIFDRAPKHISWVHINLIINPWTDYCWGKGITEKSVYEKMNATVFVSQGAKEAFERKYGLTQNHYVIHNVIDRENLITRAEEFKVEKKKFTIINVGRLENQKRHDRLIETGAILKNGGYDFEMWILGSGTLENELKNKVRELNLDEYIRFLGFQSNPYPYIKAADMFLLTSDTEGWPTVICEALCLAKPIVSTTITGAEELLSDGAGILTGFEPAEIAGRISKLIDAPSLLSRLSLQAEQRSKQFNPSETLTQIDELINN